MPIGYIDPEQRAKTERYRHQCEVRFLLAAANEEARGPQYVADYLAHPKVAGRTAVLSRDVRQQQARGNDGRSGAWL